eukprot:1267957-Rhodomonas_salina.2
MIRHGPGHWHVSGPVWKSVSVAFQPRHLLCLLLSSTLPQAPPLFLTPGPPRQPLTGRPGLRLSQLCSQPRKPLNARPGPG